MSNTRAVCLNCIDGRAQLPAIHWIKTQYDVAYVDMITEPGMDGLLANKDHPIEEINRKINLSITINNANLIVVVGHNDCKGNPVNDSVHKEHVEQSVERLKEVFRDIPIVGLWLNAEFEGEMVGSALE